MTTKVFSVSPTGRVRKPIKSESRDERILKLHRALGLSPKEAYRELQWLHVRIQSKSFSN